MFHVIQLMSEIVNGLVFVLDNLLVVGFGLLMTAFLVNNVLAESLKLFLCDSDTLIDKIAWFLNVSSMFAVGVLEFGQLYLVHFGVWGFGLDVFDEVAAGEEQHASLVLYFLSHVCLHGCKARSEFNHSFVQFWCFDWVLFSHLMSVISLVVQVFSQPSNCLFFVLILRDNGVNFGFIGLDQNGDIILV